jgi:hypothetical protein
VQLLGRAAIELAGIRAPPVRHSLNGYTLGHRAGIIPVPMLALLTTSSPQGAVPPALSLGRRNGSKLRDGVSL